MPTAAVPLTEGQMSGLEELAGAPPRMLNCLVSGAEVDKRCIRTRPGVTTWAGFPTSAPIASPVIGMFPFWNWLVFVTQDQVTDTAQTAVTDRTTGVRKLWACDGNGGYIALSDTTAATQLSGSLRPTFTHVGVRTTSRLLVAGGGTIQQWNGAGLSSNLGGSPPKSTHVATLDDRALASVYDRTGQFYVTDKSNSGSPDPYESTWINIITADARPDPLAALHDNTNEAFLFGTTTTQVYVPDAALKLVGARTINLGCGAPYSVIQLDQEFAWLDHQRRLVVSDGRQVEYISSPVMDETLAKIGTVSDCWGFRANIGSYDCGVWIFPTDNRAFCYEENSETWSEWRSYDNNVGWIAPAIRSYVNWPEKNLHLVGLSDGTIAQLSLDVGTESSNAVPVQLVSGFIDRGTLDPKHSTYLELLLRRGVGTIGSTAPLIDVAWRDDLGPFSKPLRASVGNAGDYAVTATFGPLGTYQSRQWRISYSASYPLTLVKAIETYEVSVL